MINEKIKAAFSISDSEAAADLLGQERIMVLLGGGNKGQVTPCLSQIFLHTHTHAHTHMGGELDCNWDVEGTRQRAH